MQKLTNKQCVHRIIQKLGLTPHKDKKAKHLSVGNKQRLGLAKAMIHNPEILILDEPINGLDPAGVAEIRDALMDLSKNHGVTVFLSSHLLEELAKLADRIGIIHEGKLMQETKREQLEKLLKKQLILNGSDIEAMKRILSENGYRFEENSDGLLTLSDDSALQQPEKLNELLVRSGQSPSQLSLAAEDLEGYFLRTIQGEKGAK
jgi:ABC-type multidrug transport system, ATPase component